MKKNALTLLVMLFISTGLFAEEWISFDGKGETSPNYEIFQSNNSYVEFEIEIPGINSNNVDNYNRVNIPEHTRMDSVGFPEVPVVSYLVAIPECESVNLDITLLDSVVIDNINIYPSPEYVEVENGDIVYLEEQFAINTDAYNTDAYFPGYVGEVVEKGAVRAQHCIRVKVYPMQFNPVLQKVTAYSKINISMTFNGASGSINEDVGIFNEVCGASMINYNSNGLNASVSCGAGYRDPGSVNWLTDLDSLFMGYNGAHCDYLIITHDSFWVNPNIDSLAQKRANYNGFDVVVIKMEDVIEQIYSQDPDDHAEKIRNLIKNTYENGHADNTYDNKIGYINLFGDCYFDDNVTICVPSYPMPNPYQTPDPCKGYDVYFSQLTEIDGYYDIYPDILLGRCSVDDTTQVRNVCRKIINYEPINVSDSTYNGWKDRMTFLAGLPDPDIIYGLQLICPMVTDYTTTLLHMLGYPINDFTNNIEHTKSNLLEKYEEGNIILTYMGWSLSL